MSRSDPTRSRYGAARPSAPDLRFDIVAVAVGVIVALAILAVAVGAA